MEEDPQCWRTVPNDKQTLTDKTETTTDLHPIMESTIESEQPSSPRSFSPLVHETAESVCPSDIPLEDDWFCDNRKACFHIQKYVSEVLSNI